MSDEIFIIYKNIYELIKYRGYQPETDVINNITELKEFMKKNDPLVISGSGTNGNIKVLLVQNRETLSRQKLPKIISTVSDPKDTVIIIFDKQIQSSYNAAIVVAEEKRQELFEDAQPIWYMTYNNLKAIIPNYSLIGGTCRIVTAQEKTEIKKLNTLEQDSLPKIKEYDPLNLWLGGREGDIIEYIGCSETGGRVCRYYDIIRSNRYSSK